MGLRKILLPPSCRVTACRPCATVIQFSDTLVPKLQLGNAAAKLRLGVNTGSWSFPHRIPKLELGNQRIVTRCIVKVLCFLAGGDKVRRLLTT